MLNPEDLGEIKILKDAVGTALYGIRAANGVVEISSQRFTGEELRVSYRGEAGITFRGKRPVEMIAQSNLRPGLLLQRGAYTQGVPWRPRY